MKEEKEYLTTEEIEKKFKYNIIEQYENMVYKFAISFSKKSKQNIHDLLQEAWISVIIAHSKYDETKGMKITSFVYSSIYNSLYKFTIENHDIVHIPWVTKFWEKYGYNKLKVDKYEKELKKDLKNKKITEKEYEELLNKCKEENKIKKNFELFESEIEDKDKGITLDTYILDNTEERKKTPILDVIFECYEAKKITEKELKYIEDFLSGKTKKINNNIKNIILKIKKYLKDNNLENLF